VDLQGAPITMEIKLHTYFAVEHSKKMWEMFSSSLQK
jgi:hypothetical protein